MGFEVFGFSGVVSGLHDWFGVGPFALAGAAIAIAASCFGLFMLLKSVKFHS